MWVSYDYIITKKSEVLSAGFCDYIIIYNRVMSWVWISSFSNEILYIPIGQMNMIVINSKIYPLICIFNPNPTVAIS